jgi:tetratricopeptide (TPR) repeat protein
LPVPIERVRTFLAEEIQFFCGLDGLLVGMDRQLSDALRTQAILRAENVLSKDDSIAKRIRERFLVPANRQEWDFEGGLKLALGNDAKAVSACYRPLIDGIVDQLADDIALVVLEKSGTGVDAARKRDIILRSGVLAELVRLEALADRVVLRGLMFRRSEFPKLQAADASGQVLAALVNRAMRHFKPNDRNVSAEHPEEIIDADRNIEITDSSDLVMDAVERILANRKQGTRLAKGGADDVPGIQRQIKWIGERLRNGELGRAEFGLAKLIDRQGKRSRLEDIVKTLTAVADLARKSKQFEWTLQILAAVDRTGVLDAAAINVRAETLRDLGRHEEALAALEDTMRRFPANEVAPNARAETLRDLGRYEEALAALEDTMRRFPANEVAPNARAETLRDLGRYEEALAALEDTMRRFPADEVAPTARAETLCDLGRYEEALTAFEDIMRRFPHDVVAPTARAETLRDLGRYEEALAAFEDTMRRFPANPQGRSPGSAGVAVDV